MKYYMIFLMCMAGWTGYGQTVVEWPAGEGQRGRLVVSLSEDSTLIRSLAVVKGDVDILNTASSATPSHLNVLQIWVKSGSQWQMVARQATKLVQ